MSGGERPIGAAKGKHPNTEALCQPAPPLSPLGGDRPDIQGRGLQGGRGVRRGPIFWWGMGEGGYSVTQRRMESGKGGG